MLNRGFVYVYLGVSEQSRKAEKGKEGTVFVYGGSVECTCVWGKVRLTNSGGGKEWLFCFLR